MSRETSHQTPHTDILNALSYQGPMHLEEIGYALEQAAERNRLRAYWAAVALKAYGDLVGLDVIESTIGDLLADLRHFAIACHDENGQPIDENRFAEIQASAYDRWAEEAYDGE